MGGGVGGCGGKDKKEIGNEDKRNENKIKERK